MSARLADGLNRHTREILRGGAAALAVKVLSAAVQFLLSVTVSRVLGAEGAGVFFLVLTTLLVASILGRSGLDNALLRFTASAAAVERWEEVRGVYRKGMTVALAASMAASIALYAGSDLLAARAFSKPEIAGALRVAALALVPMVLAFLHAELLKGLKKITAALFVQGVGIQGLTLLLFLMGARRWEVDGAVWSYVAAAWVTFGIGYVAWRRATPQLVSVRGRFPTRSLFESSAPLFLVAVMTFVMGWTGTLFLGVWGTSAEVGIFTAANRTALLITLVLVAVNAIAAPKFAELFRKGELDSLAVTARHSAILVTVLAVPLFLLFVMLSGTVMSLFGPEFRSGGPVLAILATGQFVNVLTGSVGYLLMMSGNERLVRNNMAVAATLNLILNFVLIRAHGVLGAAVGTAISVSMLNLGAMYLAWARLGILTVPIGPARRR